MLFSLNVLDEMQDKFGSFENLAEIMQGKDSIKNIKWLFARLINEGADEGEPEITEQQAGKLIHLGNFLGIQEAIFKAFNIGTSGTTEPPEDEDAGYEEDSDNLKNAHSGQE